MTAVVVLEHARLDDVVSVSPLAASIGESTVYLRGGRGAHGRRAAPSDTRPERERCRRGTCASRRRRICRSLRRPHERESSRARPEDTHFENPHGLDQPGHVSSARDVTALLRYALGVPFIREAVQRSSATLPGGRAFATTDDLLQSLGAARRGKTGHTRDAGWSETAAASRGGVTVYGAVLGSDTRSSRNDALQELLSFGLDQYRRVQVVDGTRVYARASTGYGQPAVELVAPRTLVQSVRVGTPLVERVVAPSALALPVARVRTWVASRSTTGTGSSRRRTWSPPKPSRMQGCGRRQSGTRRRRRAIFWEVVT